MLTSHDGANWLVMLQNSVFLSASNMYMSLVKHGMQDIVACRNNF